MATSNPYLNFSGNCEEAFNFYQSVLGGEFAPIMRFKDISSEGNMADSDGEKIMHICLPMGQGTFLMGSDRPRVMGTAINGNNFSVFIQPESEEETTRIFNGLSAGGEIIIPLNQSFWDATFGMFADKFGIQWMVNYQSNQQEGEEIMQPQFVSKPAFTVVGFRIRTQAKSPEIPQLWDQFVPRIGEIQEGSEPYVSYGLMDNFDFQRGEMDYMAGNPVAKIDTVPAGMTSWNVPANTYVVFETSIPKIGETFDHIFSTWLPTSGYQQVAGPYFERYGEDFSPNNPVLTVYIPVEKKA